MFGQTVGLVTKYLRHVAIEAVVEVPMLTSSSAPFLIFSYVTFRFGTSGSTSALAGAFRAGLKKGLVVIPISIALCHLH